MSEHQSQAKKFRKSSDSHNVEPVQEQVQPTELFVLKKKFIPWTFLHFRHVFLRSDKYLDHLPRQCSTFMVDVDLDMIPKMKWQVSLLAGPLPLEGHEEHYAQVPSPGPEAKTKQLPEKDWYISLKYELVTPKADSPELKGLYVNIFTDLKRDPYLLSKFPYAGIMDINGTSPKSWKRQILPLCRLSDREKILPVDGNGTLVLPLRFRMYTSNAMIPRLPKKSEVEAILHKFRQNAINIRESLEIAKCRNDITVVARNGKMFKIQRELLEAQGLPRHKEDSIVLNFAPEVVAWMIHFANTGEVKPFTVNWEDEGIKEDLPNLEELIQFADLSNLRDLMGYFDLMMPKLCLDMPENAEYLKELAMEFAMGKVLKQVEKIKSA